jgi:O-acetyl-ADP-ribose deacetylase (regulator of RNase III)
VIAVVVDDLAFLQVDAVLRPATDRLDPVASVSSRLDQLAGPRFAAERQVQSPLEVGSAVVTSSGDLAAPFVVHVVIRSEATNPTRDAIRRALTSAWQRASAWGLNVIAAPAVGAGAGQLGLAEAAELMARTFIDHQRTADAPAELRIVVDREDDRELVEAAVRGVEA